MNQGLYKLVYSKVLCAFVPVSEAVQSRNSKNGKRVRKLGKHVWLLFTFAGLVHVDSVLADIALPAGLSIKNIVSGTEIASATANSVNFRQLAPNAIVDWNTLNLSKGHALNVEMQRSWSMLNRIHDLGPSRINGNVNAAGNIYFINTNGIIFGNDAQINVGSLYAGTLDITNDLFNSGFVSDQPLEFKPVFQLAGAIDKKLVVEAGAEINAASGGKVLLFSETVENSGIIRTPDGQTILAAGKKVFLADAQNPADPSKPVGFLVEVDAGGTATNLGKIIAERGNITMMGLAVNQQGTLSATTSVRANGSIYLQAGSQFDGRVATASINEKVTLTEGSVTEVLPELNNLEEITRQQAFVYANDADSGKLVKPEVKIEATNIYIDGKISAKGGNVTAIYSDIATEGNGIFLGSHADIDVSGVDATAPMSRNQLSPELFSGELADNPILRGGPLFRQKVFIDARKGANGFIDTVPFEKLSRVTIAEALTKGGTIALTTPSNLIISKGAKLDVSGGSTTYEAGTIIETNLLLNGKLVPISEAKLGVAYDKTSEFYADIDTKAGSSAYRLWDLTGSNENWGKITTGSTNNNILKTALVGNSVSGYMDGDDAGTLDFATEFETNSTKNLVIDGTLLANTKVGTEQIISNKVPLGGEFIASANDLTIASIAKSVTTEFGEQLPDSLNYKSVINDDLLKNGFNRIDLSKAKTVVINKELTLNPNGQLILGKDNTQINANITAHGSDISSGLVTTIADGITITTAGLFSNNKSNMPNALTVAKTIDAGDINFNSTSIGKNVTFDTSAGAHISAKGNLEKGHAGNISFNSANGALDESLTLKAFGFNKGGELSIGFEGVTIDPISDELITKFFDLNVAGNVNASNNDVDIAAGFFSQGGFSKFSLSGLNVNIGGADSSPQEIYAVMSGWDSNFDFINKAGGQTLSAFVPTKVLPDFQREPVSFSFSALNLGGVLTLAENATIRTDGIGGSVALAAGKQVNVLGDIDTPSGHIDIKINDKDGGLPFDGTQAIFVGEKSRLSALGSTLTLPGSQTSLLKTQVFNAGDINIDAVKGAVIIKNGAELNVSAASINNDTKTLNGFVRETLYGDAGEIKIGARDGLKLDGTFTAKAAGTGRGGSLNVGFTNSGLDNAGFSPVPSGNKEFTITQQKQLVAENVVIGDSIKSDSGEAILADNNVDTLRGQISAQQISEGGFDNVTIKSHEPFTAERNQSTSALTNSVQLQDGLDLAIAGNLKIDTPLINVQDNVTIPGGGSAKLSAGHMTIKTPNATSLSASDVVAGESKLTLNAKQLYLDGIAQVGIAGVNQTEINTALDIHGQGGILSNGDMTLTARQIYPNTKAEAVNNFLNFEALGDNSKITVNSNGENAKPVLSAAGTLILKADDIVQNGILSAPFGTINLEAKNSVTLAEGSSTSISANNLSIPYLRTLNVGKTITPIGQGLSDKGISIKSANVDIKEKAVLDLSSSGQLFATEFVQGTGGTKDVLNGQLNTYAILPNFGQEYSPSGSVGESVYLTGVAGLLSGHYTLLPASYALVPGAYLVEVNSTGNTLLRGQTAQQLDGTSLTSGYFSELSTNALDANWSTFKITNGAVFRAAASEISRAPAQYQLTDLTEYFSNPINTDGKDVSLPTDVGRLSLSASGSLAFAGQVVANKGKDAKGNLGDGLQVDISAEKIRVVSVAGAPDGSLQLTANTINALNADSVLLGGTNNLINGVNKISTVAQTVSIENDSNHAINTPELIVTALDSLNVKTGSAIDTGPANARPGQKTVETTGNGASLALSSQNDITYSRIGGAVAATTGDLNIEAGSTIKAGNTLVVDATKSTTLSSSPVLKDGATAYFGANRILLGNALNGVAGLSLNASTVAALGQLKSLTLSSYNNVDIFGAFNLGNANLDLTINAAGIAGSLANGEVIGALANVNPSVITAKTFTLKNTTDANFTAPTDGSGRGLQINAETVRFEGKDTTNLASNSGKTQIAGFSELNINADEVRVAQTGELNLGVAKTTIHAGRVTGETGQYVKDSSDILIKDTTTDFKIQAQDLVLTKQTNSKPSSEKVFGAKLDIVADNLTVASDIEFDSGQLGFTSSGDLNIEATANISAKSSAKEFHNISKDAAAGSITLASTAGSVNVKAGAEINVTSQGDANAGQVNIIAREGTVNILGDLKGAATGAGKGGELGVDVKTLANFSTTDKQAQGFTEKRQYQVGAGDINVTGVGADALTARQVKLSADTGNVIVTGDIIATAPKNSRIDLYGGNGVTLTSTANLKANSTKNGEQGGSVNIGSSADVTDNTPDQLSFAAGSTVDVSGGVGGIGGEVNIIAPRTLDNTDVEISQLATTFTGVKDKVNIVGNRAIDTTSVDITNRNNALNSANNFMLSVVADVTKGLQRLGLANNTQFAITPGVEFRNKTGDLTLPSDWTLHNWRYDPTTGARVTDATLLATGKTADGQPLLAGVLSLRAKGDISFNGTLNDGFGSVSLTEIYRPASPAVPAVLDVDGNIITQAISAVAGTGVQGYDSWAYNIVAGADFTKANPLATNNDGTGNFSLANNEGIRTGSGDINIATGGNLNMLGAGSVIYTAGRVADALDGFLAPVTNALYLTDGGDISVSVKGDIRGGEPLNSPQLINNYLFRDGVLGAKDTTWWVRPDQFRQSLATLGGGDVNINAGGNVNNFSAILPTTARFDTVDVATGNPTGNQSIKGGGDLTLNIGGDLSGGVFLVGKGNGEINTGGSILKPSGSAIGSVLALQDGVFNVQSKKNQYIEAIINPTLFTSVSANAGNATDVYYNSYSDTASVSLSSLLANIELGEKTLRRVGGTSAFNNDTRADGYLPSSLSAIAYNGDITTGRNSTLLPSAAGNLELLAANNVSFKNNLTMSDADPRLIANVNNPDSVVTLTSHANPLLHKSDTKPVFIVAKTGNIERNVNGASEIIINTPKFTKAVAGKDIKDVTFFVQNNNFSDVSLIKAGEDIENINVNIAGPGELLLQATRNIDLSKNANSIVSSGRNPNFVRGITANVALPTKGASITLQAGLGAGDTLPNVQGYIDQYILPSGTGPTSLAGDAAKLAEYRLKTADDVTRFMQDKTGNTTLDDAEALALFNSLDLESKTIFANRHLSNELVAAAESSKDERGFAAIATLFPTKNAGDILMFKSKVATDSGGSIDFVAPGGEVIVGTTGSTSDGSATAPDIGILTRTGGNIRIMANGDIQVNNSKVITQAGGDIILYSDNGDIDAGKGSKTATSSPSTFVTTDANGNTTVEVIASSAGSGIRTDTADPDGSGAQSAPKRGDAKLITPRGIVNASEGGIASNNLFIRALQVLNADNIQVQGVASGVPLAATSSLAGVSAGLSPDSVNSATAAVAESVAKSASQQQFAKPVIPSILNVEVISIGK